MASAHPLHGSCHRGAVRLTLPAMPQAATRCNCSLRRWNGGIWAYFKLGSVIVQGHPEGTEGYVWGDRPTLTLAWQRVGDPLA
jgi:hypothetical protein